MARIADASLIVCVLVPGRRMAAAERAVATDDLVAPALILAEVANALWKYVRAGELTAEQSQAMFDLAHPLLRDTVPVGDLVADALSIACDLRHPVYDCLYLALAGRDRLPLVTADGRLAELAERVGVSVEVVR